MDRERFRMCVPWPLPKGHERGDIRLRDASHYHRMWQHPYRSWCTSVSAAKRGPLAMFRLIRRHAHARPSLFKTQTTFVPEPGARLRAWATGALVVAVLSVTACGDDGESGATTTSTTQPGSTSTSVTST